MSNYTFRKSKIDNVNIFRQNFLFDNFGRDENSGKV